MNLSDELEIFENLTLSESTEKLNRSIKIGFQLFEGEEDYIFDKQHVRFILFGLYTIVFCLCFFGNLAVVLVVTLHWKMRSITKFCLGNLAFANLCVGIFCIYQNLSSFLMDRWIFGHFMCKMYHFVNNLSLTASVLILVVICVERYVAILHPFQCRRWITLRRLRFIIVMVWVISAILCSPRLYYITTYNIPVSSSSSGGVVRYDMICAPQQSLYDAPIVDMIYFILLFCLPLLIISILYILIGIHLWRGDKIIIRHHLKRPKIKTPKHDDSSTDSLSIPELTASYDSPQISRNNSRSKTIRASPSPCLYPTEPHVTVLHRVLREKNNSNPKKVKASEKVSKQIIVIPRQKSWRWKGQNQGNPTISPKILLPGNSLQESFSFESQSNLKKKYNIISKREKKTDALEKAKKERKIKKGEKKLKPRQAVIRMLIVIVGTFAICNLPFYVRKLCVNYLPSYDFGSDFANLFSPLTFLLMYTNCAINPIIYAFLSKDFRSSLKDLFKWRLKRRPRCQRENSFV